MKQKLEKWLKEHDPEKVQGYVVAMVGTKRTGYLAFDGNDWTYNELRARVFGTKQDAIDQMLMPAFKNVFKFLAVVPLVSRYPGDTFCLPTTMGE